MLDTSSDFFYPTSFLGKHDIYSDHSENNVLVPVSDSFTLCHKAFPSEKILLIFSERGESKEKVGGD